jgi:hypothetical protein
VVTVGGAVRLRGSGACRNRPKRGSWGRSSSWEIKKGYGMMAKTMVASERHGETGG